MALLRLVLLPDLGLFLARCGGDGAQLVLVRHAAARHDSRASAGCRWASSLRRLTVRTGKRERVGDRLLGPALRLQRLGGAPDVHTGHRGADQVLRHRAHGVGGLVGVADQRRRSRSRPAAMAALARRLPVDDHEPAVRLLDARRLEDADRLDGGDELLVHRLRDRGAARVVRVRDKAASDRRCEVRPSWAPVGLRLGPPSSPGRPDSAAASRRAGARARRSRGRADRPRRAGALGVLRAAPLRRPRAMRHPLSRPAFSEQVRLVRASGRPPVRPGGRREVGRPGISCARPLADIR